jgi:hypothetical protein
MVQSPGKKNPGTKNLLFSMSYGVSSDSWAEHVTEVLEDLLHLFGVVYETH